MRRILLVLSVAALMAAMVLAMAVPAFAAAPDGGCPGGKSNFEQGVIDLGPTSNGIPSASVNDSPTGCTKELSADPKNPAWCCDPVLRVFRDDTVGGPKH